MRPRARAAGLVVRDLPGEVLVYDRDSHQAHCLNRTAAFVFRAADGQRTVADLARLLASDRGAPVDEGIVHLALEQLDAARLLEAGPANGSRRELLKRVGLGAVILLPAVTSLLVPTPAEAANTCIPVESCPGNTQQPCYNVNPNTECPTNKCIGFQQCG